MRRLSDRTFQTVADACGEHFIDEEEFRQELRLAIGERVDT